MRCDDDRPVHHLLRATATTSRDHLTRRRPPSRSFTRTALTSHPSIPHPRPHRRHRPGRALRPTGTTPIEPFDRPSPPVDRPRPSHPIPSHRAALSLEISRADDGHRVEDTWRTTHLHYGDSPPTHTTRSHPISLEVAISRAFTSHDSPRVLDRDTRVPHSTDHDSTRPPTSPATDRALARWWVTRRRPRVVTRARAFRTGHRRRA